MMHDTKSALAEYVAGRKGEDDDGGYQAAAENVMRALKKGDAKEFADALRTAILECENENEAEGPGLTVVVGGGKRRKR